MDFQIVLIIFLVVRKHYNKEIIELHLKIQKKREYNSIFN